MKAEITVMYSTIVENLPCSVDKLCGMWISMHLTSGRIVYNRHSSSSLSRVVHSVWMAIHMLTCAIKRIRSRVFAIVPIIHMTTEITLLY